MMSRKKNSVFLILFCIFLGIIWFSLQNPTLKFNSSSNSKKPDFYFQNVKIVRLNNGKKDIFLSAKEAVIDKKTHKIILQDLDLLLKKNDVSILSIKAPLADCSLETYAMRINSSNAIIDIENKKMYLESRVLFWNPENHFLRAEQGIKIVYPPFYIKSKNLFLDLESRKLQFEDNVHVDIQKLN